MDIDVPYEQMIGDDISKIKNNTIIGNDAYEFDQEAMKKMLQKNLINLPGATPMNTQMDEE